MKSTSHRTPVLLALIVIAGSLAAPVAAGVLDLESDSPGTGGPLPVSIEIDGRFDDWADERAVVIDDEGGADDFASPAWLDVTRFGVSSNLRDAFYVLVAFDDLAPSDSIAATLIDVDLDGRSDYALVVTLDGETAAVDVHGCDDSIALGCGGATPARALPASSYATGRAAGPWNDDLLVEIELPYDRLASTDRTIVFTALVSYAAESLLNSPKDSVLGAFDQDYAGGIRYDRFAGVGRRIDGTGDAFVVRRHSDPAQVRSAAAHAVTYLAPFDDDPGALDDGQAWFYVVETSGGAPRGLSAHPNDVERTVRLGFDDGRDASAPVDPTLSTVTLDAVEAASDGTSAITVTVVPRDTDGVPLGAGCVVGLDPALLGPGTTLGAAADNRDGSYTFRVVSTTPGDGTVMVTVEGIVLDDVRALSFR